MNLEAAVQVLGAVGVRRTRRPRLARVRAVAELPAGPGRVGGRRGVERRAGVRSGIGPAGRFLVLTASGRSAERCQEHHADRKPHRDSQSTAPAARASTRSGGSSTCAAAPRRAWNADRCRGLTALLQRQRLPRDAAVSASRVSASWYRRTNARASASSPGMKCSSGTMQDRRNAHPARNARKLRGAYGRKLGCARRSPSTTARASAHTDTRHPTTKTSRMRAERCRRRRVRARSSGCRKASSVRLFLGEGSTPRAMGGTPSRTRAYDVQGGSGTRP
jgi:hypothetical protein